MLYPSLYKCAILFIAISFFGKTDAQQILNGSFEGKEAEWNEEPYDWDYWQFCADYNQNSPDIFPGTWWSVTYPASDEWHYVNLAVKEDGSEERLYGQIVPAIDTGTCFKISLDLAVTNQFVFESWGEWFDFTTPASIEVDIGTQWCHPYLWHWRIDFSSQFEWTTYSKMVYAEDSAYGGIKLSAKFNSLPEYYGHILIDNVKLLHTGDTANITDTLVTGDWFDAWMPYHPGWTYQWLGTGMGCDTCRISGVPLQFNDSIIGVATDSTGCYFEYHKFRFHMDPIIPNVITPNGDGNNELFRISGLAPDNHLKIYNRWGALVYNQEPYQNNWDAHGLPEGVYYFWLRSAIRGVWHYYTGYVHVLR